MVVYARGKSRQYSSSPMGWRLSIETSTEAFSHLLEPLTFLREAAVCPRTNSTLALFWLWRPFVLILSTLLSGSSVREGFDAHAMLTIRKTIQITVARLGLSCIGPDKLLY